MTTTGGFGGEGPVVLPTFVRADGADGADAADGARSGDRPVADASPDEVAAEAAVVSHLDDPEVDQAIERLRAADD